MAIAQVLPNATSTGKIAAKIAPRLLTEVNLVAVCLRHLGVVDANKPRKLGPVSVLMDE